MKKVLYISNIESPYRAKFFDMLAGYCDLTVLYERKKSSNRDSSWAHLEACKYNRQYLGGIRTGNETAFSLSILKFFKQDYDIIIIGCYNTPAEAFALLFHKSFPNQKVFINLDGEQFIAGDTIKSKIKRYVLKYGDAYLVAGEKSADNLKKAIGHNKEITPYYFSSLSVQELEKHRNFFEIEAERSSSGRNNTILVIGQYFEYKGLDIALEAAAKNKKLFYRFVGMGKRAELFQKKAEELGATNIEVIPFLQKKELEEEYLNDKMLVLPSRKECWGLVVNEAASFGMPVVSTWGSGAAVEFLSDDYPEYLTEPGDAAGLLNCIEKLLALDEDSLRRYSRHLINKSCSYSIDRSVQCHIEALELER